MYWLYALDKQKYNVRESRWYQGNQVFHSRPRFNNIIFYFHKNNQGHFYRKNLFVLKVNSIKHFNGLSPCRLIVRNWCCRHIANGTNSRSHVLLLIWSNIRASNLRDFTRDTFSNSFEMRSIRGNEESKNY